MAYWFSCSCGLRIGIGILFSDVADPYYQKLYQQGWCYWSNFTLYYNYLGDIADQDIYNEKEFWAAWTKFDYHCMRGYSDISVVGPRRSFDVHMDVPISDWEWNLGLLIPLLYTSSAIYYESLLLWLSNCGITVGRNVPRPDNCQYEDTTSIALRFGIGRISTLGFPSTWPSHIGYSD